MAAAIEQGERNENDIGFGEFERGIGGKRFGHTQAMLFHCCGVGRTPELQRVPDHSRIGDTADPKRGQRRTRIDFTAHCGVGRRFCDGKRCLTGPCRHRIGSSLNLATRKGASPVEQGRSLGSGRRRGPEPWCLRQFSCWIWPIFDWFNVARRIRVQSVQHHGERARVTRGRSRPDVLGRFRVGSLTA